MLWSVGHCVADSSHRHLCVFGQLAFVLFVPVIITVVLWYDQFACVLFVPVIITVVLCYDQLAYVLLVALSITVVTVVIMTVGLYIACSCHR